MNGYVPSVILIHKIGFV